MKRYTLYIIIAVMATVLTGTLTSCKKSVSMTSITVQDSIRHYYPLVQGTDLTMVWHVTNTGNSPLVITDVQPSCGCIELEKEQEYIVIPGKGIHLTFIFHSSKNCGYVKHTIRLFGNIKPSGMASLIFDTNVVPPADFIPDYEQLYKEQQTMEMVAEGSISVFDENADKDPKELLQDKLKKGYWVPGKKK